MEGPENYSLDANDYKIPQAVIDVLPPGCDYEIIKTDMSHPDTREFTSMCLGLTEEQMQNAFPDNHHAFHVYGFNGSIFFVTYNSQNNDVNFVKPQ